jgi:hypothetical protein
MKKILFISIIALFVFLFALFISAPPMVYAEGELTTEITTEPEVTTTVEDTEPLTTTEDELTEAEIQAILAQLDISGLVNQAWDALMLKVPWLGPVLGTFGIVTPTGLIAFIFIYLKRAKKRFASDAQLDTDINANTDALVGTKDKPGLKQDIAVAAAHTAELEKVVTTLVPVLSFTAKALNILMNASNNDAVQAQAEDLAKTYQKATGDLGTALRSTGVGAKIAAQIDAVRDKLNL